MVVSEESDQRAVQGSWWFRVSGVSVLRQEVGTASFLRPEPECGTTSAIMILSTQVQGEGT